MKIEKIYFKGFDKNNILNFNRIPFFMIKTKKLTN